MKNEIKEIQYELNILSNTILDETTYCPTIKRRKILLDYITNLQEENKEQEELISRLYSIIDDDEENFKLLDKEIERLNKECDTYMKIATKKDNIINETLEIVCCIEHNLDKYEEIGGDHLEYATNKVYELKDYLIEELKEKSDI